MEEQSKQERDGKGQDPDHLEKPHGHEGTTADKGMISKGSSRTPQAESGKDESGTSEK